MATTSYKYQVCTVYSVSRLELENPHGHYRGDAPGGYFYEVVAMRIQSERTEYTVSRKRSEFV